MKSENYEAPHYANFSSPLLLHPLWVQKPHQHRIIKEENWGK
jgi:hypothetical protein